MKTEKDDIIFLRSLPCKCWSRDLIGAKSRLSSHSTELLNKSFFLSLLLLQLHLFLLCSFSYWIFPLSSPIPAHAAPWIFVNINKCFCVLSLFAELSLWLGSALRTSQLLPFFKPCTPGIQVKLGIGACWLPATTSRPLSSEVGRVLRCWVAMEIVPHTYPGLGKWQW